MSAKRVEEWPGCLYKPHPARASSRNAFLASRLHIRSYSDTKAYQHSNTTTYPQPHKMTSRTTENMPADAPTGEFRDDSYVSRSGHKGEEIPVASDQERIEDPTSLADQDSDAQLRESLLRPHRLRGLDTPLTLLSPMARVSTDISTEL